MKLLRSKVNRKGLLIVLTVLAVIFLVIAGYWVEWTGFDRVRKNDQYEPIKTLWDWMDLLIVPLVLAVGGLLYNRTDRLNEQRIAHERAENERAIAEDGLHEATLQGFFDRMSDLLLKEGLRLSEPQYEVRSVAQARTLTVLRRLDPERKGIVVKFLHDSRLIDKERPIISLQGADLRRCKLQGAVLVNADLRGSLLAHADLRNAILTGANLQRAICAFANLEKANLEAANLEKADFHGANFTNSVLHNSNFKNASLWRVKFDGAKLHGANLLGTTLKEAVLSNAILHGAVVSLVQLEQAASLRNAIMPDGSKHS